MNTLIKMSLIAALAFLLTPTVFAQQKAKKVKSFKVTKVIPFSAEKVWAIVGADYGAIANSHPKIIRSNYINGTLKAEEGAERICYFNKKGTQYLKEKITSYDPENMTFVNTVSKAGKFPVDPAYTKAIYKVTPIDANSCEMSFDMEFRTKPAILGGMMKGSFKKLIQDYMISIEHHIRTGEKVTAENFKDIKKLYASK